MRTYAVILFVGVLALLLSCGQTPQPDSTLVMAGEPPPEHIGGVLSLEEMIIDHDVIVRGVLATTTAEVVVDDDFNHEAPNDRHRVIRKFNFMVDEYLKGSGPSSIVAVWGHGRTYETEAEGEAAKDRILAETDTTWERTNESSILFLDSEDDLPADGSELEQLLRQSNHFSIGYGDPYYSDDGYSIHSEQRRAWLPLAPGEVCTVDLACTYLLAPPPTDDTIRLTDLKQRVAAITAELARNGSDDYQSCVRFKYQDIRHTKNWPALMGYEYTQWNTQPSLDSGSPAGTEIDRRDFMELVEYTPVRLEGNDSGLFTVQVGPSTTPNFEKAELINTERPLPPGEYSYTIKEQELWAQPCDYTVSNDVRVTVEPGDALHEFFFDPVTVGSVVAADSSKGVLKPTSFTGADGASATIRRIAWEPSSTGSEQAGAVKVEVSPHAALGGHTLDFIELDGSMSLSLNVNDALKDTSTGTLTWQVPDQPWHDGDLLMVRIRRLPPTPQSASTQGDPTEPVEHPSPTSIHVVVQNKAIESPTPIPVVKNTTEPSATPVVVQDKPVEPPVSATTQATEEKTAPDVMSIAPPVPLWAGDSSLGQKIIHRDTVVKATMTSFSSEVVVLSDFYRSGTDNRYSPMLKFNLSVSEYLFGTGSTSSVAIWFDGHSYETREEANEKLAKVLERRDGQWDSREAIIFLISDPEISYGTVLDGLFGRADHYYLSKSDPFSKDDLYSLHSNTHRLWLPATATTTTAGDSQQFLLDVPPTGKTISLGALKQRIQEIAAELAAGDGSDSYRRCLENKYEFITNQQNWPEEMGSTYNTWNIDHDIVSGLSAGTILDKVLAHDRYPDSGYRWEVRIQGRDASLFTTGYSAMTNLDTDSDGDFDEITYDILVTLTRPSIAGEYSFDLQEVDPYFKRCNFVITETFRVIVTAPDGVLHEFFFDPVTVGNTVAADSSNGVLKPASFTGASGVSASINRISWESGVVKVNVTPHNDLARHTLDFIELDGSVSLSLNVNDALKDTSADTLTWRVPDQPWHDGDLLMVRIRRSSQSLQPSPLPTPDSTSTQTATPDPSPTYLTEEIHPCTPVQ